MAQPHALDEGDVVEVAHWLRQRAAAVERELEDAVSVGLVVMHAHAVGDVRPEPARPWRVPAGELKVSAGGRGRASLLTVSAGEPARAGFTCGSLHGEELLGPGDLV